MMSRGGGFALFVALSCAMACSEPTSRESFVYSKDAVSGVYSFPIEMEDSAASYDFWIYARTLSGEIDNLEIRTLWLTPSGESLAETVYLETVDSRGVSELYRSAVVPSELGEWKLNLKPVVGTSRLLGLGIVQKEHDGTR